ncbi:P-loop containing nucleoside triphosphate hydrolase protein [Talaromyces proteolyticus]|uniref:P-loop containing nucleoside triphosphate hydrolase protein n=1 Tax=Talaromyces proteolyticus TaxID=1131652 RepID=A0AAD4KD93_9EURO|nr:P-loop containing nucleoside triphosphate hydrolase protein [Talaromyces proteolyticus]KAH8688881.1 P-loop containing nucleoside triphosphate hydrolase protein [Talaromyces proteolyticus]
MFKHLKRIWLLWNKNWLYRGANLNVANRLWLAIRKKKAVFSRIEELKLDKARVCKDQEEMEERIVSYSEQASIVSPRVPVDPGQTPDSLDRKLEKLYKELDRFDQQMGASREEIAAELLRADNAFKNAERQLNELEKIEQIFKNTINYRRERWRNFRAHISSRAKAQFTYLLSERSFRGRLLTDHENKLLDLQVEPDITKDSAGRGAKTLSGGEKSFSQVCLLLSLWEAMGSPIRCLDEFDVYMDVVNRKMSIDMLMLAARRSIGRQFILITPGSRAEISLAPDVRIKELAEPERGQRTLSFRPT